MSLFNFPILGDERANYTLTLLVFTHNSTLNEKENVCSKRLIFWTPINWAPPAWAVLAPWRQRENLIPGLGYSPSSISILSSTNALPSLGNKVAPSVLILLLLSSLSPSLRTSKPVSLSLWGIETVNAWGFDVPLLCEPSQSSAGACLPSLHHLIILCGGRGRERLWNSLFHTCIHLSVLETEFLLLTTRMPSETPSTPSLCLYFILLHHPQLIVWL